MKRHLLTFLFSFLLIGSVHAQLDTNNNGMSDIWERHFNDGELFPPGILAEGDEDGDGQSNLDESLAGTDPFEFSLPDGYFKADVRHVPEDLGGPGPGNPETYEISWYGVAGKQYILQGSFDLQNWIPITTETGEDKEIIIGCFPEDENDLPEIRFFWRVKVDDVDSDWDGLTDYEEILFGTDPLEWSTSYVDHNYDWDYDISDFRIAQHYELYADFDPDGDDDGDGISNIDELWNWTDPHSNLDSDGDGMPDDWELFYGLDPNNSNDAAEDEDEDGLTNLQEYQFGSSPTDPETSSGTPDIWITLHYQSFSEYDPSGDDDNDELTNYEEFLHDTNPHDPDSDNDGVSDGVEVRQGSDPNDASDQGKKPLDPLKEVEFKLGGDYASWRMEITGKGPRDHRRLQFSSRTGPSSYSAAESFKLHRNNKYEIKLYRLGGKKVGFAGEKDWYCWAAAVGGKPDIPTHAVASGYYQLGARNNDAKYFVAEDYWIVDNSDGLFTSHLHSYEHDIATGLVATMIPIEVIEEIEDGEAPDCTGYDDEENALMVPIEGSNKIKVKFSGATADLLSRLQFVASVEDKLTINPVVPTSSDQVLTLSGTNKALGVKIQLELNGSKTDLFEADILTRLGKTVEIHAVSEENDDVQVVEFGKNVGPNEICVSSGANGFRDTVPSGDDVIVGENITTGENGICDTVANNQNLVPAIVPTAANLQEYLNNQTWGNQANVYFTVTRSDHVVNYDLDRNEKLADEYLHSKTRSEDDAITNAARNANVDYNIYYIKEHEVPIGITLRNQVFTQGGAIGSNSVNNHTAHEIGHLLGIARESKKDDPRDLMYKAGLPTNPRRISRFDWRDANP